MEKKAILFCDDNTGIVEFAQFLNKDGWTILSNGKTAEILKDNNISFKIEHAFDATPRNIQDSTLLIQKILKTKILGNDNPFDNPDEENNYFIVCVNFDPLSSSFESIPKVGIGSPALDSFRSTVIRNCCTNFSNVLILTDPNDYKECIIEVRTENMQQSFRMYLAGKALNMISAYDSANANAILQNNPFAQSAFFTYMTMPYKKHLELKKGSNSCQKAVVYQLGSDGGALAGFRKIHGNDVTHKIVADTSFAWEQICSLYENLKVSSAVNSETSEGYPYTTQFTPLTGTVYSVLVKYRTVVGAGLDTNVRDSFKKTLSYDMDSNIHSTFATSAVIDADAAREIAQITFSAVMAPSFTEEAKQILSANPETRLIIATRPSSPTIDALVMDGGVIVQDADKKLFDKWTVPTKTRPTQKQCDELAFGMCLAKATKSYSGVCIKDYSVVGIASSYSSRFKALGSVLFEAKQTYKIHSIEDDIIADVLVADTEIELCEPVKEMIEKGVKAILQTGGHPNDKEFIDYCDEHNVAMIFTGVKHTKY
ncbi:MAG: hypothetical protein MJ181_01520 [Treponema sp.]|nr:hypothetical protein [Treponema sp.]